VKLPIVNAKFNLLDWISAGKSNIAAQSSIRLHRWCRACCMTQRDRFACCINDQLLFRCLSFSLFAGDFHDKPSAISGQPRNEWTQIKDAIVRGFGRCMHSTSSSDPKWRGDVAVAAVPTEPQDGTLHVVVHDLLRLQRRASAAAPLDGAPS